MVPFLFHGQTGGLSVQLHPFQFLFCAIASISIHVCFLEDSNLSLATKIDWWKQSQGIKSCSVILVMVLFSLNLRLQMIAITFSLILLLVCESNEGPIKASSLLFIKEKDKTSIPPHLIGKKDFSTRAFEGFLTLVKESRLPCHGVQFLVPSLSYDPCEDRSKTKIISDRIVIESTFNILLNAEWLVIDFHKCKVLWLPLKFWEQNINFYMPMFQFIQMAYNVFIA